jgi:hypothetical protein
VLVLVLACPFLLLQFVLIEASAYHSQPDTAPGVSLRITTNSTANSSANSEVFLPDDWNARVLGTGNGGLNGMREWRGTSSAHVLVFVQHEYTRVVFGKTLRGPAALYLSCTRTVPVHWLTVQLTTPR